MTKSVAVPSRLYYTPTEEKPLAGVRSILIVTLMVFRIWLTNVLC